MIKLTKFDEAPQVCQHLMGAPTAQLLEVTYASCGACYSQVHA